MIMKVKEVYKNHDKRVINYMENVVNQIEHDYHVVPASWRVSLDLIADSLEIYFKALDDISINGIWKVDDRGRTSKNQACAIQNVSLQQVVKLLSNFGLTPLSKSKVKNASEEDDDDVIGEYLSAK